MLSVRNPHEWYDPVVTAVKFLSGGSVWPLPLKPQQTMVPSARNPHEWFSPVVTAVKIPLDGSAWP